LNRLVERVSKSYDDYDFHQVYYDIHHFCTVFLSQFYLDVLKDRLYVLPTDSEVRRSAQTVLYEVLLTLVKITNPILPHTTEEVWKYIPGDREISVQLCDFPVAREDWYDEALEKKWDELLTIRDVVLKALEEARAEKLIGNSLGATVEITPNPEAGELLRSTDHLDQLFIVSDVVLNEASSEVTAEEKVKVTVRTAEGEKCERCWVISPTVGQDADHPHLCSRCATIVKKLGVDLSE
jgi:isoleucyl-tRNA synthetase